MKKFSTVQTFASKIFKEQKLTIGLDLGEHWSFYCVLDEAGKIVATAMEGVLPIPGGGIAQETISFSGIIIGDGPRLEREVRATKTTFEGDSPIGFWLQQCGI